MAIQPSKSQNRVFLLVGIVLAAAAAAAVLFAISRSGSNVPSTSVVVAKSTLSAGTPITADMLTTNSIPNSALPADPFSDPSQVVGKTTPVAVSANSPLTQSMFTAAQTTVAGQPVVPKLDITKGYVAMAIPAAGGQGFGTATSVTGDLTSVGFYIQPDDHIDILIDPGSNRPGIRYSFQDVRVLRVGTSGAPAAAPTVYVVELPRNQAEMLTALITGRGPGSGQGTTSNQVAVKYVLRSQSEYGKADGSNGFDKPNYVSNAGTPLNLGADTTVTPDSLNSLFSH